LHLGAGPPVLGSAYFPDPVQVRSIIEHCAVSVERKAGLPSFGIAPNHHLAYNFINIDRFWNSNMSKSDEYLIDQNTKAAAIEAAAMSV